MRYVRHLLSGLGSRPGTGSRLSRAEFALAAMGALSALAIALAIDRLATGAVALFLWLAAMLPYLQNAVWRRLHDTGRRGAWTLAFVVPLAAALAAKVFPDHVPQGPGWWLALGICLGPALAVGRWLCAPGTPGPNRYGEAPPEMDCDPASA